jgi:hypothetical protein
VSLSAAEREPVLVHSAARLALKVEIDVEAEQTPLSKGITCIDGEITKTKVELGNQSCVACAGGRGEPVASVRQSTCSYRVSLEGAGRQAGEESETLPIKRTLLPSSAA